MEPATLIHTAETLQEREEGNAGLVAPIVTASANRQFQVRKIAALFGLLTLCACSAAGGPIAPGVSPVSATVRAPQQTYALHASDLVQVRVYNEPEISGHYLVDGAGYVSIPLAGRIRVAGLTASALEKEITSRLTRGLIKDPKVSVQISTYAPFYIHGEVKNSGEFPYKPGMTVLDAVAAAGGFTYRADEDTAYLRSARENVERAYSLASRVPIRPGDNIRIGERFF